MNILVEIIKLFLLLNKFMENTTRKNKYLTFIDVKYNWQQLKKEGYTNSNLYIKNVNNNKGLGVFSKVDIHEGEVVEYCHSVRMETPRKWLHDKGLKKYCYWDAFDNGIMPLGFGPIYNTADRQHLRNTDYFIFLEDNLIAFVAQKDIKAHEEILVWWGDNYYQTWCQPKNANQVIKE